jgi:acetylornithine deacetylase
MPVSFGTDVPRLSGCHKKYLYGPGSILDAHGENEQVTIPDLIKSVAVYKRLVLELLKG